MKILEIIQLMEAKPDNLGQGLLDKLFATYQKRDINDTTIPKFSDGLGIANLIFKYSGPQKLIWTAKQYTTDQHFFLHDLANWKNIFDLFDRPDVRQRLEQKDINQYKSIDELKSVILPLVQQRENMTEFDHILEAVDKFVKKGEAEWLFRGTNYSIYHPISFYSSNVLLDLYGGKNHVDVCTVTGKGHFNDNYAPNGYLIYTLTPDNFYVAFINQNDEADSEFSDKQNNHIKYPLSYQIQQFPELRPIIMDKYTDETGLSVKLEMEPNESLHYQICWDAVMVDPQNLYEVPEHIIDKKICRKAMELSGNLQMVPKSLRDYNICTAAVSKKGRALEFVPTDLRDYAMCSIAVKKNPLSIAVVPDDVMDYDMCKYAMDNGAGGQLHLIPERFKDYDMCYSACINHPWALKYVPEHLKDYKMCIRTVEIFGLALNWVPEHLKDETMCMRAIEQNSGAIHYVPDGLL